jgi:large subunit ribosomal protein L32
MAVPKQKQTKSRSSRRRSHHALNEVVFSYCPKCGLPVLPHHICKNCGTYASREVIDVLSKLNKKERKKKEKELANQEETRESEKELSMQDLSKK